MKTPIDSYEFVSRQGRIEVDRVDSHVGVTENAVTALTIMREAYLGEPVRRGLVSADDVNRHFDPEDDRTVRRQQDRMTVDTALGSSYWFASVTEDPTDLRLPRMVGLAKTSPSRPAFRRIAGAPNCFLNDVAVAPLKPEIDGVGSALLYAALGDFKPKREVVMHAINRNPRFNNWMLNGLGLRVVHGVEIEPLIIGNSAIPQIQLGRATVGHVRDQLVARRAWLAQGQTVDRNGLTRSANPLY